MKPTREQEIVSKEMIDDIRGALRILSKAFVKLGKAMKKVSHAQRDIH